MLTLAYTCSLSLVPHRILHTLLSSLFCCDALSCTLPQWSTPQSKVYSTSKTIHFSSFQTSPITSTLNLNSHFFSAANSN